MGQIRSRTEKNQYFSDLLMFMHADWCKKYLSAISCISINNFDTSSVAGRAKMLLLDRTFDRLNISRTLNTWRIAMKLHRMIIDTCTKFLSIVIHAMIWNVEVNVFSVCYLIDLPLNEEIRSRIENINIWVIFFMKCPPSHPI